ncbi:hypothetical protein BH20ACT5_BH20ACT5_20020 [soil metagenome]
MDERAPGRLGDRLEGVTVTGHRLAVRVRSVRDPADDAFAAEGIGVPDRQRSLIVASEFTNRGRAPYAAPPDLGLVVIDEYDVRHGRAVATLTAYPRFRHAAVGPGDTVAGHTYFVLPRGVSLRAVLWSARPEPVEDVLRWEL